MADAVRIASTDDDIDAITLQLEEVEHLSDTLKRKYLEGGVPDDELAFLDFAAELQNRLIFLHDAKFARSYAKAQEDDAGLIEEVTEEERQMRADRALAISMNDGEQESEVMETTFDRQEAPDEEQHDWFHSSVITPASSDNNQGQNDDVVASSSRLHLPEPNSVHDDAPVRGPNCVVCMEELRPHEIVRCPCEHTYCVKCLKSFLIRATKDESLFPPRCCRQAIPRVLIEDTLSKTELSDFESATVEFTTTNRTYCSNAECAKFVPPNHDGGDEIVCPYCDTKMCTHCKGSFHAGECVEDQALRAVLQLAEGQRWRRCHGCNALVELDIGCNHMT